MTRGKGGRGGHRQPSKPAAVSNPGSGRRTDGGAGSSKQPLRVAPGQGYGARQEMEAAQSAAPMAVAGGAGTGTAAPAPAPPPLPTEGVFGPTSMPSVPMRSPVYETPQFLDAETLLRILYSKRPSPWLARLMDNGG